MKILKHLPLLALILFIIWCYFSIVPLKTNKTITNLTHSKHQDSQKQVKHTEKTPKQTIEVLEKRVKNNRKLINKQETIKTSFLKAYRDLEYFSNCFFDLHDIRDNIDPLKKFSTRVNNENYGDILGGGDIQLAYLKRHLNKCKNYLLTPEENIVDARIRLENTFWSIEPKTLEEKDLSNYLNYVEELMALNNTQYEVKDKKSITLIKNKIEANIEKISSLIKHNRSPDVFLHLESISRLKKNILKRIQNETKINDLNYLGILYELATPLFACSLGYPCDKNSVLIYKYCISKNNKNACGINVEEFYLNFIISPNLQNDFTLVLEYLMNSYAQI